MVRLDDNFGSVPHRNQITDIFPGVVSLGNQCGCGEIEFFLAGKRIKTTALKMKILRAGTSPIK
jgi:hypothetical protein